MSMSANTAASEIERFCAPSTVDGEPELGWPDGVDPPPDFHQGTTQADSALPSVINVEPGLTPGALVGGFAVLEPFFPGGSEIVSNTASSVTVAGAAQSPNGQQTVTVNVSADGQTVFELPGAPNVGAVLQIVRLGDGTYLAADDSSARHDPENGVIAVYDPDPENEAGDTLTFIYTEAYSGGALAGYAYTLTEPKSPTTAPLSVGAAWAGAYRALVEGVTSPVPLTGKLGGPEAAMRAVVDPMMTPPLFAPALQAGMLAFWASMASQASSLFPNATTIIPPAPLAGFAASYQAVGAAVQALGPGAGLAYPEWASQLPKDAASLMATALYTASQGGLALIQAGPVTTPTPIT